MIELKNITKTYHGRNVLRNITLQIAADSASAILGKSGAGKSTLLNIIGTLDKPSSGSIFFDTVAISSLSLNALAILRNQKIGFIFQFHHLLPEFTAIENVCLPAWIAGENAKTSREKAAALLAQLDMGTYHNSKPSELSGGEQQRIAIARAFINSPSLILADEPTGNLDTQSSKQFIQLIMKMRKEKQFSFVMVTHDENMADYCEQKIYIEDGALSNTVSKV